MNSAQRALLTRILFSLAAACVALVAATTALLLWRSNNFATSAIVTLWVGWPVATIGLAAWLLGLYTRAGGKGAATIPSRTGTTEVVWSETPGCFERHLQRKHNNHLFPEAARRVTPAEVAAARNRDSHEAQSFREELSLLAQSVRDLPDAVPVRSINALRERIDVLLHRACELGGHLTKEREGLAKLRGSVLRAMRSAAKDDPESIRILDEVAKHEHAKGYLTGNVFLAQLGRVDTPITGADEIPALLTEHSETIREVIASIEDRDYANDVRSKAIDLLLAVVERGYSVPGAAEKLEVLGATASFSHDEEHSSEK